MSSQAVATAGAGRAWEAGLIAALLGLAALAWAATGWLATPHMRVGLLTMAPSMSDEVTSAGASVAAVGLFLSVWLVMMAAMMLPAVAPVVVTVDRWARRTGAILFVSPQTLPGLA